MFKMNKLSFKNNFKILTNYKNKFNFINLAKETIYDSIQEISNYDTRKQVEKNGIENMHKYFSVDHIPFLQFLLNKKYKKNLYKKIFEITSSCFNIKKNFYIDQTLNFRIHYPFNFAKKSSLSRSVYRGLDLKNYSRAELEIKKSIQESKNYIFDTSDKTKIKYFGKVPVPCYGHSPHRDTWFGHSSNALNLWWGITKVNSKNGIVLFRNVYKYDLKHLKQPAYVNDIYNLGKTIVPKLNSGDLLLFDPEILHATRLNTSNTTRVAFSGRINFSKPKFYNKALDINNDIKKPYWFKSNDVKVNNFNNTKIFLRNKKNYTVLKKKLLNKSNIKCFKINKNLKKQQTYKLFKIKKQKYRTVTKVLFKNTNVCLIQDKTKFIAFSAICPHLKFDLSLAHIEKNKLTCQGHGLTFDINSGKSTCSFFKIKKYKILNKKNNLYLLT